MTTLLLTALMAGGILGSAIPATAGDNNCTKGYKPCIKDRPSDVDCRGGSGNGPRYTKAGVVYKVHGADPYGLDADNDHRGCE